ncbi:MAG: hypothetical protein JWM38_2558, partial [Sphingomonas bacterium]|nr:hypothetical protein [Sphingomonas bacterium]
MQSSPIAGSRHWGRKRTPISARAAVTT